MTEVRTPYPLSWPAAWPRARSRGEAKFSRSVSNNEGYSDKKPLTMAIARQRLQAEIDRLGAREILLSSNVELNLNGDPRGDRSRPSDPGVALYFKLKGKDTVLACDRWDRVEDNIAAIAKHIDAIRGMERWGVGSVEQVFTGYQALPHHSKRHWTAVLRVASDAMPAAIEAAWKDAARSAATDQVKLLEANMAREEARAERTLK